MKGKLERIKILKRQEENFWKFESSKNYKKNLKISRNQEQPKNLSTLQNLIAANDREKFEMDGRSEKLDYLKGEITKIVLCNSAIN